MGNREEEITEELLQQTVGSSDFFTAMIHLSEYFYSPEVAADEGTSSQSHILWGASISLSDSLVETELGVEVFPQSGISLGASISLPDSSETEVDAEVLETPSQDSSWLDHILSEDFLTEVELVEKVKGEISDYFKISLDSPWLERILSQDFSTSSEKIKREIADYFKTSPDDFWGEKISLPENPQDSLWSEGMFLKDSPAEEGELSEIDIIDNEYFIETLQDDDSWKEKMKGNNLCEMYSMIKPQLFNGEPQKRSRSSSELGKELLVRNKKQRTV